MLFGEDKRPSELSCPQARPREGGSRDAGSEISRRPAGGPESEEGQPRAGWAEGRASPRGLALRPEHPVPEVHVTVTPQKPRNKRRLSGLQRRSGWHGGLGPLLLAIARALRPLTLRTRAGRGPPDPSSPARPRPPPRLGLRGGSQGELVKEGTRVKCKHARLGGRSGGPG